MAIEYRVMMANVPIYGVFKKKANTLEAAWKIVKFYEETSVPYENFYVQEWEVNLLKTHYKGGVTIENTDK